MPLESALGRSPQTIAPNAPADLDNGAVTETKLPDAPPTGGAQLSSPARRRRRSASPLPPHPTPADIPEDAPGRVAFFAMTGAPDFIPATAPAVAAATVPAMPLARTSDPSQAAPDTQALLWSRPASPTSAPAAERTPETPHALTTGPLGEWLPVVILGAVMLFVFIVGMVVTR